MRGDVWFYYSVYFKGKLSPVLFFVLCGSKLRRLNMFYVLSVQSDRVFLVWSTPINMVLFVLVVIFDCVFCYGFLIDLVYL